MIKEKEKYRKGPKDKRNREGQNMTKETQKDRKRENRQGKIENDKRNTERQKMIIETDKFGKGQKKERCRKWQKWTNVLARSNLSWALIF